MPNSALAKANYEKAISASVVKQPDRYNILIKGQQFCLTRGECVKLYQALLQVLPQQKETVCDTLIIAVARAFKVSVMEIKSPLRAEHVVLARHAAIWLAENMGLTRHQMSEAFHKQRTTIVHALKHFKCELDQNEKLKQRMEELRPQIWELIHGGGLI